MSLFLVSCIVSGIIFGIMIGYLFLWWKKRKLINILKNEGIDRPKKVEVKDNHQDVASTYTTLPVLQPTNENIKHEIGQ